MSGRLAALAAQLVGRRVELRNGAVGTVTRVTREGFTVAPDPIRGIRSDDIKKWVE